MGYYVDVQSDDYVFYYNMVAEVNKNVQQQLGNLLDKRPISMSAKSYINNMRGGNPKGKEGPREFGVMGSYNKNNGIEYESALTMNGITATLDGFKNNISYNIALLVLDRAIYYCPKDTGYLASTGRIEQDENGLYRVYFDCPYAWFVHEFTWKQHTFPTCAKFLTLAIQETQAILNGG